MVNREKTEALFFKLVLRTNSLIDATFEVVSRQIRESFLLK
jgi:hypothetical protein